MSTLDQAMGFIADNLISGCDSANRSRLYSGGASNSDISVTPTKNGWMYANVTPVSGQTTPSAATIKVGNYNIAAAEGSNNTGVTYGVSAPVKAGLTYVVRGYRAAINYIDLFYPGGGLTRRFLPSASLYEGRCAA